LREKIGEMVAESVTEQVTLHAPEHLDPEEWKVEELAQGMKSKFGVVLPDIAEWGGEELVRRLQEGIEAAYQLREGEFGAEAMRRIERWVMLQVIDTKWKEHLYAMDHLREGIGYRAYGQQDPLVEYQHEAFRTFNEMVGSVRSEVVELIFKVQPVTTAAPARILNPTQFSHPEAPDLPNASPVPAAVSPAAIGQGLPRPGSPPPPWFGTGRPAPLPGRPKEKVGRNDPCPCGSGKKYKKCHGR